MRRIVSFTLLLFLPLLLIAAGPASGTQFAVVDLEGTWSLHAFGVYDVKGVYYFGTLELESGLITGGGQGVYAWSEAQITGGGLSVAPSGEITGILEGYAQDRGSFWIAVKMGWMEIDKNQITFIGSDDQEYQLLVTLVKVR